MTGDVLRPDQYWSWNRNVSCEVMGNRQNVDGWRIRDVSERYRLVGLGNDLVNHRYHQTGSQFQLLPRA